MVLESFYRHLIIMSCGLNSTSSAPRLEQTLLNLMCSQLTRVAYSMGEPQNTSSGTCDRSGIATLQQGQGLT